MGEWRGLQSGAPKRALREDALKDTLREGKEAEEAAVFAFESVGCNQEKRYSSRVRNRVCPSIPKLA